MKWTVRENGNNVCPGLRLEDLPNKIPANMHILHNNGMLSIASETSQVSCHVKMGMKLLLNQSIVRLNLLILCYTSAIFLELL